jgi:hypothetical protein
LSQTGLGTYDEIIGIEAAAETVWLKLDLVSKTCALGLPVTHVEASGRVEPVAPVG